MSEETGVDAGMMITGVEQMEEGEVESPEGGGSPKELTMDEEIQEREQQISGVGSSPGETFPSLSNSQSSGNNKMIPYVSPIGKVRVLKFEDTLSEEDCRGFNLIYESLLLEGRVGNLTDLTMGMVLVENPPAWLQVMHERLKHSVHKLSKRKRELSTLLKLG